MLQKPFHTPQPMKNYCWILFDADDTLFHFNAYKGLQLMFCQFGIQFTEQDYQEYQVLNQALWLEYQNHKIVAEQLQHRRFDLWAKKLQLSPQILNTAFLVTMAEVCQPLKGAIELLDRLKGQVKLGIITNGFAALQQARLERTGLKDYFDVLIISEQVGVAKPHPRIFDHALDLMENPDPKRVLMVGDNPHTDILGGINAGFDTCWVNCDHKALPEGILPTYQVSCLTELDAILAS